MADLQYIPVRGQQMKTYIFQASIEQEDDGRWSAWIDALPGCSVWGYSKEEALDALKEAAQAYLEVLVEKGQRVPLDKAMQTIEAPVVAVTL
ncbi:MAG: type II toxin-antitoxin system HicB family antitoxin [Patescibacteria group bacterium]